ncbi:hypothetical protein JYT82_00105, partial [bacterium AH-315-K20]|nr:hypothetical protein [bacterium AH-315-K20]
MKNAMTNQSGNLPEGVPDLPFSSRIEPNLGAAHATVPIEERLMRWVRRATVVGFAVSILIHLLGWFIAAHMSV